MLPASRNSGDGVGNQPSAPLINGQYLSPRPTLSERTASPSPAPLSSQASPRGSSETTRSKDGGVSVETAAWIDENDPKETILEAFLPRVAVYASADTEELVRLKGIYGGFRGLLRPFGESIPGNVVIRDSVGASKSWNNFGIHFTEFGTNDGILPQPQHSDVKDGRVYRDSLLKDSSLFSQSASTISISSYRHAVDAVVDRYLTVKDRAIPSEEDGKTSKDTPSAKPNRTTPAYYTLYLRKLLSQRPMVPHETFTHPIACVIAISSQCTSPLETLRELYNDTRQGAKKVPIWTSNEFLRYYVLVHDEDHDDVGKSMALYDQMKRHFGLHCHLLRLRSIPSSSRDDDCTQLPDCQWLSAEEELQKARQAQDGGDDEFRQYLFDTDTAVIKTFIREMVTQSILPFMEGRVTTWNDQVASRRRGISGRFMSLSKRWTGFGSGRGARASPSSTPGPSGSNYDPVQGYYAPDSPEATMHRLADYAFMLRDWKLASSIYDLLRTDFNDDKAWNHHAAANEMAALSLLFTTQPASSRVRPEIIDAVLDAASYSYITRCENPQGAARCLMLAVELYRNRGGPGVRDATRWGEKLLEMSILSPLANVLLMERLAFCYALQQGTGKGNWDSRKRKTAFSYFLAADVWLRLGNYANAQSRLRDAAESYEGTNERNALAPLSSMQEKWSELQQEIVNGNADGKSSAIFGRESAIDEETEDFDTLVQFDRSNGLPTKRRQSEVIDLLQRLNDPLDQEGDGFV
ncbi:hypothetical protein MMC30_007004 [Trapelia coarctata]|nr:hypothetical protein [Trapelia coarctata]